jgi:transposase
MPIGQPKTLTECQQFFQTPQQPRHRLYEALRAYFVEHRRSKEVARAFGYTVGTFRVLCHQFRRAPQPDFFCSPRPGPRQQPKKSPARQIIVQLRKQNYSVYDISQALKDRQIRLSATAVREVLKEEGFAPLPRRLDEERPAAPRATPEPTADVRCFSLAPHTFLTNCGGLFLFIADLVRLDLDRLARATPLPGSKMIPNTHALRACVALKLWSVERKSHVMSLVSDEGLALFAGLNAIPKKSYFSEYSSRIDHAATLKLLARWQQPFDEEGAAEQESFNLDFHSVPYHGAHPVVEAHYVSSRSRRQPSILVFLAQDADGRTFCYSNADLRKGEEAEEIFAFIAFWKRVHGRLPRHLVFDSQLTTYDRLARLDAMGITFITLRRRSPRILQDVHALPPSAWRRIELDIPTRQYRTPRVYEQIVKLAGCSLRQVYVTDLGHEEPTILLTNDRRRPIPQVLTRYAQRMLVENAISDAIRFFHMDALSSSVGLKVDFDMALLVIASKLYRLLAHRMRGYSDSQARQLFRDIIDLPATVTVTDSEVEVQFHRRAHLPIILASGLMNTPLPVPWWNGKSLRLTTYMG